ncbi:hypothetical protein P168DRAFT_76702 [Aspergillus campestris IBT 28561]|uniref:Azaphilone pigments biosynthesis cluster protein L N-terminal domain-containing protein n=1 Tax=Aspergillus campestris (strain IBT 28561) TaxID=1392248 RepID=A0A2I1CRS3_ASPC2|nr:uncharacterized protein P168DRAFT_76702 [Aspergillus campestris IBT 28561]PKY00323.1 hypothetical protein P168DRAFT_76702 [Aspergillus campestris IBT 28561]
MMAEPIGLASGLLTLSAFAFQSSVALYEMVTSFQSHPKRVRDLIDELEALSGILEPLTETVAATTDIDLSALELPLLRCGKACEEFQQEILKCLSRSSGSRTSFRDWAKLKYMGDDIDAFRRLLAGYKSTINIALTDANLSSITSENLGLYEDLVESAKADLEAHLENIDGKLERILGQALPASDSDALELRKIKEERLSTEKCLQICAQLSEHISQIQRSFQHRGGSPSSSPDTVPERVTSDSLQECKDNLELTISKLEKRMQDVLDRMVAKSKTAMTSEQDYTDLVRLRDEWDTAHKCMDICSKANNNLKENISTIDNYATGDALQFMVSTSGQLVRGKNRGLGWRTRQVGGHLSDTTVQQLSRDMTSFNLRNTESYGQPSQGRASVVPDETENEAINEFKDRYGQGFQLAPKRS